MSENGWLHVSKDDDDFDMQSYAELLQREFGADVEFWPPERVREQLKSPLYFSGIQFNRAFTIHPLNYALGLAKAAEAAGARIFEDTPAIEIDPAASASASSRRLRASERTMSCSPATCISAGSDAAHQPARCFRSRLTC